MKTIVPVLVIGWILSCAFGCRTSRWIIEDPVNVCQQTCSEWGWKLSAIVSTGDRDPTKAEGATSCVCTPPDEKLDAALARYAAEAAVPPEIKRRTDEASEESRKRSNE